MIKGEGIKRLIPQRYPMLMVDEFEPRDDNSACTALTVRSDNMFVNDMGEMPESGLIEHIAQSVSALAGYKSGQDVPPVGIIGEIKKFICHRRPLTGDKIETTVSFTFSFGNVTIANGISSIDGQPIAETQLKVFMQP